MLNHDLATFEELSDGWDKQQRLSIVLLAWGYAVSHRYNLTENVQLAGRHVHLVGHQPSY